MNLTTQKNPECYITSGKNRIKQFEDKVYLKNGQTFEIELYNPTNQTFKAELSLNNQIISSSGIVLRPGERVFLERFIDTNNRFVFETYQVKNNAKNIEAISNNGLLNVNFFTESVGNYWYINTTPTFTTDYWFYNTIYMNLTNSFDDINTGRIEKGERSNQEFSDYLGSFNNFPMSSVTWKLLPESVKPITKNELNKVYCTGCGYKIRKTNWKFCPKCGTKVV